MSTLFGILDKSGADVPAVWLQQMQQAALRWSPDACDFVSYGMTGLGCAQLWVTPGAEAVHQPLFHAQSGLAIVFDGRLDNRESLQQSIGLPSTDIADEEILLLAYLHWGVQMCAHLLGDFAFAIWDGKQLYLGRDQLGVRPLFVAETSRYFAFASDKRCLLTLPWVDKGLDEQWIADFLCITKVSKTATVYKAIQSFAPAHWLTQASDQQTQQCYWSLDADREIRLASDEEYIEQFEALLKQAVACRLRSRGVVASELSGGLDSTTVSSVAAGLMRQQGRELVAVSHMLAPEYEGEVFPFADEKQWIAELCQFAGIQQHIPFYAKDRGVLDAIAKNVEIHAGPSRSDLTLLGDEMLEHLRRTGVRVLLSGFGGDQLVSCATVGFYEELARDFRLRTLWYELGCAQGNLSRRVRGLVATMLRAVIPAAPKTVNWSQRLSQLAVNVDFAHAHGYPQRWYENPTRPGSMRVRQRQFQVINSPHVLYRLEDSALGAAAYGVEYRYPLLDIRLLEFVLALPLLQKRRNGYGRRMLRVGGTLPSSLQERQDKSGTTMPSLHHRLLRDRESILARLDRVRFSKGCGYVDCVRLDHYARALEPRAASDQGIMNRGFYRALMLLQFLNTEDSVSLGATEHVDTGKAGSFTVDGI